MLSQSGPSGASRIGSELTANPVEAPVSTRRVAWIVRLSNKGCENHNCRGPQPRASAWIDVEREICNLAHQKNIQGQTAYL